MYGEFEVHRTMIRDRVRTDAFHRAINAVVCPGDTVLDVGAGSGILSMFAARAGAARVYAVERTPIAGLAEQLAAANGVADTVTVIQADVIDIELPEQVDVIVSEWLGGFGIDEGMLAPVIAARDRWLKPGGVMIPHTVTAWTALVHDRYLADMIDFLQKDPFGLKLEVLVEDTVNEIIYSGSFRHLAADDLRSEPRQLWTTNADRIRSSRLRRPTKPRPAAHPRPRNGQRPGPLVQRRTRARRLALRGARRSTDALGNDDRAATLARSAHARDCRPRQSQDRPGATDGDMDELGHRHARRRLGGARRAVSLGGDRRLSNLRSPWRLPGKDAHRA